MAHPAGAAERLQLFFVAMMLVLSFLNWKGIKTEVGLSAGPELSA